MDEEPNREFPIVPVLAAAVLILGVLYVRATKKIEQLEWAGNHMYSMLSESQRKKLNDDWESFQGLQHLAAPEDSR